MYQWLLDPERVDLDGLLNEQQRILQRTLGSVGRASSGQE